MPCANATTVNLMNFKLFWVLSLASGSQWCDRNAFQTQNGILGHTYGRNIQNYQLLLL